MIKNACRKLAGAMILAALALIGGGCSAPSSMRGDNAVGRDLDAARARAFASKKPLVLLVVESGQSRADNAAQASFETSAVKTNDRIVTFVLDIGNSRNRATAARFHAPETPLLLCLSSRGIIVNRDQKPIAKGLVLQRIAEVVRQAPALDAKFAALEDLAGKDKSNAAAQFELTDFLLAHQNAFEAIPLLEMLAHSETNAPMVRVRAWVALSRAHLWIAEPEKGRHEAEDLIATLGAGTPEARAGGELVLGIQDANGKRVSLARWEFEEAIAAAPKSTFGEQAAGELAKLPKDGK